MTQAAKPHVLSITRRPLTDRGCEIEDAWDDFARELKQLGRSGKTVETYRSGVFGFRDFLMERGRSTLVEETTRADTIDFLAHLQDVAKPATCRARYSALKRFYAWCAESDEIDETPMATVKAPAVPFTVRQGLSDEETLALLTTCEGRDFLNVRDRAIISVMLSSGIRLGELTALQVEDVTDPGRVIIHGKGRKERQVSLGAAAIHACRQYLRRRRSSTRPELFLTRDGRPMMPHAVQMMVRKRGKDAGILTRLSPHRLRRTYAQSFLGQGGHPDDLRVAMGHTDLHIQRTYVASQEGDRALKAMEQYDPLDKLMRQGKDA